MKNISTLLILAFWTTWLSPHLTHCQKVNLSDQGDKKSDALVNTRNSNDRVLLNIKAQRVFRYAFNPSMFHWKHGDYGGINRYLYSYLPALTGLPDMPGWMKYKYSKRHSAGIDKDNVNTVSKKKTHLADFKHCLFHLYLRS